VSICCVGIGVGAESHIAIGEAYVLRQGQVCIAPSWIPASDVEAETSRFEIAVKDAAEQLYRVRQQIPQDTPIDISEFIDTHLMMIEDKAISSGVITLIQNQHATAEWALQQHCDALIKVFEQMDDAYLRTRKDDLDHVVNRIQKMLIKQPDSTLDNLNGQVILAEDLSPADIILLKNQNIAGFVTDYGGPMSHTAILARSLGIPAIVGARGASSCLVHGELLILDTDNGCVLADCEQSVVSYFEDRREFFQSRANLLRKHRDHPATTADDQHIELLANIELAADVETAANNGANGIGLYRTEFLYMTRRDAPSEEEHFDAYLQVIEGMQGKPITIRTLDLGADKKPIDDSLIGNTSNPALGLRAIRLCLKEPTLFRPQIRAILRASAFGKVRIMLPMLTNLREVQQSRAIIERCMHELAIEGIAYDADIQLGGMIEVPAAALTARSFAQELDFLSIGTNDLIQYTLAIDRIDDEVNYLYDPFHPAVLQLIAITIAAAKETQTPLSMCGEMAGDLRFVPLLLGMGLRSFSMQPMALLDVKQLLRKQHIGDLEKRAQQLLNNMFTEDPLTLLSQWQLHSKH